MKKGQEKTLKKPFKTNSSIEKKKQQAISKIKRFPSFNFFPKRKVISFFLAILIIFFVLLFIYSNSSINEKNENVLVDIPTGSSFLKATEILNQVGLVKYRILFYSLTIFKNARRQIRAGEYEINTSLTPSQMIEKLIRGEIKQYPVLIPEDLSIYEIAERLYDKKLINKEIFFELARDKNFLESLNIKAESIEGYLFPDTYFFDRSMSTRKIMKEMVDQFWKKVTPEMKKRADDLKWDIHKLVTFASIIGKESGTDAEKPMISSVFHNRMKKRMPLQSDPTAIYDLGNFQGKIVRSHLRRKSPYNTYVIKGLPPGPIANPGIASFRAALYPADVNYLYFVSKKDGTHFFSSSLVEHNKAVNRYRYIKNEQLQYLNDKSSMKKKEDQSPDKKD